MARSAKLMIEDLVAAIAAEANLSVAPPEVELFAHAGDETIAKKIDGELGDWAVIAQYGGVPTLDRPMHSALQLSVFGRDTAKAIALAEKIRGVMVDADDQPRIEWALATIRIKAVLDLQPWRSLGKDDRGRAQVVVNFEVSWI